MDFGLVYGPSINIGLWTETTPPEKPFDFGAPPPSPIPSGRTSCVTNDDVLSEFLQHSLRVPDLILPDKVFPRQNFIENPPKLDFQVLNSMESDTLSNVMDSVARIGCFQLVNHGIQGESIRSTLAAAAGIFQLPPEKRMAVTRSPENKYGFEEVHGEEDGEGEISQEFLWCKGESLKLAMNAIWPAGYSNFSDKMETLQSELEKVAEKILMMMKRNFPPKSDYENGMVQGQGGIGSGCYLYKHRWNGSGEKSSGSLGYDVIRMLIKGFDYSHAMCLHVCDGSSEFHVYSKKGWLSFSPDKDAMLITIGDQIQALSGGQFKHVIGRPIYKRVKNDYISLAFLYSPPSIVATATSGIDPQKRNTISLGQQAIVAIVLTLVYYVLVHLYNKF